MATARWPRWITSTQCGRQHGLCAWWWWSRRWAAAAVDAATSAAASPTGRCGFILSIAGLFLQRPLTTSTPPPPAAFPAGCDWRRACSPRALLHHCGSCQHLCRKGRRALVLRRHRRRTQFKSPADGPDKRSAPRGAGELGRRTRAARATVRFLCVRCDVDPAAGGRGPLTVEQPSADPPAPRRRRLLEPAWVMPSVGHRREPAAEVGGKALNLAELLRGGFRVPPGFCLTTDAYERVTDQAMLRRRLDELAATPADDDTDAQPARRGRRDLVLAAAVPAEVEQRPRDVVPADGAACRGGRALVGHRRGPAVRQLRRPAGHLPQRRRRGRRAGRGPPLLGVAVDRARRRLPRQPAASTTPRVRLAVVVQRMVDAEVGRRAVHRQPGHRAAARRR